MISLGDRGVQKVCHVTVYSTVSWSCDSDRILSLRARMQPFTLVPNFCVTSSRLRLYSTFSSSARSNSARLVLDKHGSLEESKDALLRKRKTEWKRRQQVCFNFICANP